MSAKLLLAGGCVLTLGARTPNFSQADVLIVDGAVSEVGPALRARDAERVDATETIVMPGFVDTHRHASRSLFRNLGERGADVRPVPAGVGDRDRPEDVYAATLIGLLGAAEAGITTVVDWSPIRADAGLAEAALRAHADSGLRTVFVYAGGGAASGGAEAGAVRELLERLTEAAGPATTIAFGVALPDAIEQDASAAGWATARELGMRIHVHQGSGVVGKGVVARLGERGLLGEDVTLVHCRELDDADLEALSSSGASLSLAPSSEMAGGRGSPPIQQLIDHDIRPGLGVDDEQVAPGDLFAQMREMISLQHAVVFDRKLAGKAGVPRLMTTRDVIRFGTVDGARVAGLGGVAGSIEPGMRADVILLRTDRPNIFPINDPIGAVVWGMDTSNIDRVFVDGRPLMHDGVLEADVPRARSLATAARDRVVAARGSAAALEGAG